MDNAARREQLMKMCQKPALKRYRVTLKMGRYYPQAHTISIAHAVHFRDMVNDQGCVISFVKPCQARMYCDASAAENERLRDESPLVVQERHEWGDWSPELGRSVDVTREDE